MAQQAQDTFIMTNADGADVRVVKGEVLPDNHPAVALDESGVLFQQLPASYDQPPVRPAPASAEKKPHQQQAGKRA